MSHNVNHHLQGVHGGYLSIEETLTRDLPFPKQRQNEEAA
jgi:hypothetical protein